jgi:hypothetical protein
MQIIYVAVLHGTVDRLIEIGRCYGMETNVGKNQANGNLKATFPNTDYEGSKTTEEFKIFYIFG